MSCEPCARCGEEGTPWLWVNELNGHVCYDCSFFYHVTSTQKEKEMDFKSALASLKSGEAMVREAWDDKSKYIVLLNGMKSIWQILANPLTPNAGNWLPLVEDMLAEDWKILEQDLLAPAAAPAPAAPAVEAQAAPPAA